MKSIDQILSRSGYAKKLDTAEWRNFSERIRKESGNFCQCCKRANLSTQVHHIFYDSERQPWEYQRDEVVLLCAGCHKAIHEQLKQFRKFVFGKMTPQAFQVLNGALAVAFEKYDPLTFAHALAEFVSTPTMIQRYANAWNGQLYRPPEKAYDPECGSNTTRTKLMQQEGRLG